MTTDGTWSAYAASVAWNVTAEDVTVEGQVLASATVHTGRAYLRYEKNVLADSWLGSAFVRWTGDGDLLDVALPRAGRQVVRRRDVAGGLGRLTEIEAGGFHAYAPSTGRLAWLAPRRGDPYRTHRTVADVRKGISGWRCHVLRLDDGRSLVVEPADAGLVPGPVALAGDRLAATIARADGPGRRQSGLLLVDLDSGAHEQIWDDTLDLHTPVLAGNASRYAFGASSRLHDGATPLNHQVYTRGWGAGAPAAKCVHEGWEAWAAPLAWAGTTLHGLETRCGVRRVVALDPPTPLQDDGGDESVSSAVVAGTTMASVRSSPVRPDQLRLDRLDGSLVDIVDDVPAPPIGHRGRRTVFAVGVRGDRHTVGTRVVQPESTDPRAVVVLLHGGPTMSWSHWSWRWNPLPFVALGFAVVLVDPAGSDGFGRASLRRAWRDWQRGIAGSAAEAVRATLARERLDGLPLALMGGSFGGYLAVRLAGLLPADLVVGHAVPFRPSEVALASDAYWSWTREWVDGGATGAPRPDVDDIDLDRLPTRTRYLFSHGLLDDIVPHLETVRATRLLRLRGARCDAALLPSSGHALTTAAEIEPWLRWATTHAEEVLTR